MVWYERYTQKRMEQNYSVWCWMYVVFFDEIEHFAIFSLSLLPFLQWFFMKMFLDHKEHINSVCSWWDLVYLNMSSLPTGFCAVQWAMWKGGGFTCLDRFNSSENYLLIGFLLISPRNLCSYWPVSHSVTIIVLSQFPTLVPVKLSD